MNVVPMDYYYSWSKDDLENALIEMASAQIFAKTEFLPKHTPFIDAVLDSDLVIDFSANIWEITPIFLGKIGF